MRLDPEPSSLLQRQAPRLPAISPHLYATTPQARYGRHSRRSLCDRYDTVVTSLVPEHDCYSLECTRNELSHTVRTQDAFLPFRRLCQNQGSNGLGRPITGQFRLSCDRVGMSTQHDDSKSANGHGE
ncbi:hypothetical protein M8818_004878 [Zalaria obscura]|uniref:Uncharacterized protein n=1 Tax=Zalaria obscura TaxID=2024903 RepID=A0ACC3SAP3_9PEZI